MSNNSELQHSLQDGCANIYSHFDRATKKNGDRIAVACGGGFLTYRQLEYEVDKIASALLVHLVQSGTNLPVGGLLSEQRRLQRAD